MNIQTYQLSLEFEQILNLVRQLPFVEQESVGWALPTDNYRFNNMN